MIPSEYVGPYIASNVFALAVLIAAFRRPGIGRTVIVVMFVAAGIFNVYNVLTAPSTYVEGFGPHAMFGFYRDFIEGFFSRHTRAIVLAIAAGQIACGIMLTRTGRPRRLGVAGAVLFLVAIGPLDLGSAFPSSLILGWATAIAFRTRSHAGAPAAANIP